MGGRQGLMSTAQGCTSLHRCSESVTEQFSAVRPAGQLASQAGRPAAAGCGRPAGRLRLRQVVADINCKFAVGDLCQRFPDRLDELICRQGDRLRS